MLDYNNSSFNQEAFKGDSSTLIILHGWRSSKEKWQAVRENLERRGVRVIIPDLPGFKDETELNEVWDLDDYVEWFEKFSSCCCEPSSMRDEARRFRSSSKNPELFHRFTSRNNNLRFFLLGHSFGGRIAIKYTAKNPEKVKGLILVSSAGIKHKKTFRQNLLFQMAKAGNKFSFLPFFNFLRKVFYKFIVKEKDYPEAKGYLKETFKKIISEDLTRHLEQIKPPTLIIWGEKDKMTPISDAYLMNEKIKNSKLKVLKNIGHLPYRETPKKLSEVIMDFLR